MVTQIQTPRQASRIYGFDGPSAARPKHLFVARFKQATASSLGWRRDLCFVVKSIDRPSIQPVVEEVNQYNKKRQVHTGYKMQPVRMSVHDTADSMAMRMWSEYTKHYFGDFRHEMYRDDFRYDATSAEFKDSANAGFGFAPGSSEDLNNQFYFDSLQIFQVFGGQFVQFDLINPKITGFDPDELNYEDSGASMINMTIAYEAIIYRNGGAPLDIRSDPSLSELFADKFGGAFLELANVESNLFGSSFVPEVLDILGVDTNAYSPILTNPREYASGVGSGILSSFGNFNFGAVSSTYERPNTTSTLASDLSYSATNNPVLASVLNLTAARTPVADASSVLLSRAPSRQSSIDAATYDSTKAAVNAAGGRGQVTDTSATESIVQGSIAAAISTGSTGREQVGKSGGMSLSDQTFGVLNAQRSPSSQIGYNANRRK